MSNAMKTFIRATRQQNSGEGTKNIKLFIFPHSGSGPGSYLQWAKKLEAFEVVGIQYPGRGSRMSEPHFENISELAQSIVDSGKDEFTGQFVFFGHSLGSLVAYEVVCELIARGLTTPASLLISAFPAPPLDETKYRNRTLSEQDLFALIEGFSPALLPEIKSDSELQELFLGILKGDYQMLNNYEFQVRSPLPLPIQVLGGKSDEVPVAGLDQWKEFTKSEFKLRLFAGGHFYFLQQAEEFFSYINETLSQLSQLNKSEESPIEVYGFKYIEEGWNEDLKTKCLAVLSQAENDRFLTFKSVEAGKKFLQRKAATRVLLAKYSGQEPQNIKFKHNENGKPEVANMQFNVSTSGNYFIIAISKNKSLGVDIEKVKETVDMEAISSLHFSQLEQEVLRKSTGANQFYSFYQIWSEKEAFVKALGIGLNYPLNAFTVKFASASHELLHKGLPWQFYDLNTPVGYHASLCIEATSRDPKTEVKQFWGTAEDLKLMFINLKN